MNRDCLREAMAITGMLAVMIVALALLTGLIVTGLMFLGHLAFGLPGALSAGSVVVLLIVFVSMYFHCVEKCKANGGQS